MVITCFRYMQEFFYIHLLHGRITSVSSILCDQFQEKRRKSQSELYLKMSVILTACRNSKQRAIERALKKKAEEKKAKREAREARMMAYQECSAPQVHTVSPDVTSWSFILDDAQYHVQFRMYTGEVFCNGVQIMDVMETFSEHGLSCSYSFTMSSHKAMITTKDGMKNCLTIDGEIVAN